MADTVAEAQLHRLRKWRLKRVAEDAQSDVMDGSVIGTLGVCGAGRPSHKPTRRYVRSWSKSSTPTTRRAE